jgi:hypothetical protein
MSRVAQVLIGLSLILASLGAQEAMVIGMALDGILPEAKTLCLRAQCGADGVVRHAVVYAPSLEGSIVLSDPAQLSATGGNLKGRVKVSLPTDSSRPKGSPPILIDVELSAGGYRGSVDGAKILGSISATRSGLRPRRDGRWVLRAFNAVGSLDGQGENRALTMEIPIAQGHPYAPRYVWPDLGAKDGILSVLERCSIQTEVSHESFQVSGSVHFPGGITGLAQHQIDLFPLGDEAIGSIKTRWFSTGATGAVIGWQDLPVGLVEGRFLPTNTTLLGTVAGLRLELESLLGAEGTAQVHLLTRAGRAVQGFATTSAVSQAIHPLVRSNLLWNADRLSGNVELLLQADAAGQPVSASTTCIIDIDAITKGNEALGSYRAQYANRRFSGRLWAALDALPNPGVLSGITLQFVGPASASLPKILDISVNPDGSIPSTPGDSPGRISGGHLALVNHRLEGAIELSFSKSDTATQARLNLECNLPHIGRRAAGMIAISSEGECPQDTSAWATLKFEVANKP